MTEILWENLLAVINSLGVSNASTIS